MADSRMTWIYVLRDPRDESVRYVGKTVRLLKTRLKQHISVAKTGADIRVSRWIRSLLAESLQPTIEAIEEVSTAWAEREIYWISHYRSVGIDLVNHTAGGEGALGRKNSKKQSARLRETLKLLWSDPDYKATRMAAMNSGKTPEVESRRRRGCFLAWTPERLAKQAVAMKIKRASEKDDLSLRQVMTEAARVAWLDPDHKADRIKKMKAIWTPERRAAQSARSKALCTPAQRVLMSERAKAQRARELTATQTDGGKIGSGG